MRGFSECIDKVFPFLIESMIRCADGDFYFKPDFRSRRMKPPCGDRAHTVSSGEGSACGEDPLAGSQQEVRIEHLLVGGEFGPAVAEVAAPVPAAQRHG